MGYLLLVTMSWDGNLASEPRYGVTARTLLMEYQEAKAPMAMPPASMLTVSASSELS